MKITLQVDELKALLKSAGRGLNTPSLDQLLAWGSLINANPESPEAALARLFDPQGIETQFPIAFYTAFADGLEPVPGDYWMRADPASLQAGMSKVFLAAASSRDLSISNRSCLQKTLNEHFAEDGLQFFLPNNQRWYIRMDCGHPQLKSPLLPPPRKMLGKDITSATVAMNSYWQACFTELQMLLFAEPDRLEHEARGQVPVSAMWLWGGGFAVEPVLTSKRELVCSGNSAMLQGLAHFATANWQEEINLCEADQQLMHWPGDQGDTAVDQLKQLESRVFTPLLEAIRQGAELDFIAADAGHWKIRKQINWPWSKQLSARSRLLGKTDE